MLRFVGHQLRASPARSLVLGVGLLVAGAGFVLLNSVSVSSAVAVQGTLNRNFTPAYDILVRPKGSETSLERSGGLVNDGFLSDLYGGISDRQWRRILRQPGVSVAAPVENVGYSVEDVSVRVNLRSLLNSASQQVYRITPSLDVHDGLASYPEVSEYLYYSKDRWVVARGKSGPALALPGQAQPLKVCDSYVHGQPANQGANLGPFALTPLEEMRCAGPHQQVSGARGNLERPGRESVTLDFEVPALVAAIDPVQETRLVGLSKAITAGSYLREHEGVSAPILRRSKSKSPGASYYYRTLPIIASSRTFLDEALKVRVQRLRVPKDQVSLPERLAKSGAGDYLDALPGETVRDRTYSTADLYRKTLSSVQSLGAYWTTSAVGYRVEGRRRLAAKTVKNPGSIWEPIGQALLEASSAPSGANATQFRQLRTYDVTGAAPAYKGHPLQLFPGVKVQGTFDPGQLKGFAPLSKVPLGTFFPPTVTGATRAARAALHHKPLGPTTNVAGYIAQPPLFLTTLKAAAPFFNSTIYTGKKPRKAPIAAIQVRVSGIHGASRASIQRVKQVAAEIYSATHLQVDITAGSSPTPVRVDLPAGGFGQPALTIKQGWVKKGVATVVLDASNAKDSALFALILVVALLFVANASFAAVRQRRGEIATLATLGWERRWIFSTVLGEVTIVGLIAGVAGAAVSAAIIATTGLHFSVARVVGVIPASMLVALLAGGIPAWNAARLSPLAGLTVPVRSAAAARRVRSVTRLGWVNLTRLPWRTVLGGFGLVIGVGALAFLWGIQHAFSGAVAGNVLGNHINVEVRGADYAAVGLILALAVGSVADVLIMNLRERAGELATLQATGWNDGNLRRLVVTEGLTVGVTGALVGALIGLAGAWALGANPGALLLATAAAFATGVMVCATAVLPALSLVTRQAPAITLAPE